MFEDNPFADQVNPYQYLEMYEEECWLQHITQQSQQLHGHLPSTAPIFTQSHQTQQTTQESLQFEPFDIERLTERTAEQSINEWNSQAVLPISSIQADQFSATLTDTNAIETQSMPVVSLPAQSNQRRRGSGVSFNTTDYIIKHCFKKMLAEDLRDEVEPICEANHLSYQAFVAFWRNILKKYPPNRHIGLTRFMKMIEEAQAAVIVCRVFFSSYLREQYPRYIAVGYMLNKQEYLRCATKLMYISCLSRAGFNHIQSAREQ